MLQRAVFSAVSLFKAHTPAVAMGTFLNSLFTPLVLSSTLSEMASVRAELLTYFTHVLLGDALAAEYLVLHLISNVYVQFMLT